MQHRWIEDTMNFTFEGDTCMHLLFYLHMQYIQRIPVNQNKDADRLSKEPFQPSCRFMSFIIEFTLGILLGVFSLLF